MRYNRKASGRAFNYLQVGRAPLPQRFRLKLSQAFHQQKTLVGNNQPHTREPAFFQIRNNAVQLALSSFEPSPTASTSRKPCSLVHSRQSPPAANVAPFQSISWMCYPLRRCCWRSEECFDRVEFSFTSDHYSIIMIRSRQ